MSKRKTYILDTKTRNISFLQVVVDLRKVGVENNMFFLRLYDESLQRVNPFSENLTEEQMIRILNECMINPWYFLRECVRIPDQGGNGVPYQLHRANLAATFCFLLGIDHYLVIPRQKGKTQSTLSIIDWAFLFGTTESEIALLNKRGDDANKNLDRLKKQRDLLPDYMQQKISYDDDGKELKERNNVRSLVNPGNGNSIITKPSANSVDAAEGIGRGATQPIQYFDEPEWTPHIKTIVEAAGPAFITASNNAKRNGAVYCRIFTSTPGDQDSPEGQESAQIIAQTCRWTEKFYDWTQEDITEYIEKNSGNGIVYIEYSYTQLGEGEEWFNAQCRVLNGNEVKIKREILLKRMRGSVNSPFEPEELDALTDLRGVILEEIFINKLFPLILYQKLKKDRIYMVGVDVAMGYGEKRDNSALEIVDPYTLEIVAEFKSPYIGEIDYIKFIYSLLRYHIPKAIVIIERNKGGAIIEALRQTEYAPNIYFENNTDTIAANNTQKLDTKGFLQQESERRRMFGVWTGEASRARMFDLLYAHMKEKKEKFIGHYLIDDILSLVVNRSGKVIAGPGFHDDCVMAYLMVLYVYYHGSNLSRFGFVKGFLPEDEKKNLGLSYEEVYDEMPDELKEVFKDFSVKTLDDYQQNIGAEIKKARESSGLLDGMIKPKTYAENFDVGPDGNESDLDIFDFLNSD